MANTENTREKKTIRKRARPLRGAGGTVTEEEEKKNQRYGAHPTMMGQQVVQSLVSDTHCWGARALTPLFQMAHFKNEAAHMLLLAC